MQRFSLMTLSIWITTLSLTLLLLSSAEEDYNYNIKFIQWGGHCKIPLPGELSLPSDGCDETRGIICQKYSQGMYCGCPIESSFLSYDRTSGECRRKPGEHCIFVNSTLHPNAYSSLPRHVKCHSRAECLLITTQLDSSTLNRKGQRSISADKEISKCFCNLGYKTSRDGLECVSLSSKSSSKFNGIYPKYFALFLVFNWSVKNMF